MRTPWVCLHNMYRCATTPKILWRPDPHTHGCCAGLHKPIMDDRIRGMTTKLARIFRQHTHKTPHCPHRATNDLLGDHCEDNVQACGFRNKNVSRRMLVADRKMFPWAWGTCIHPKCEKAAIACHIWARDRMVRFGPRERQDRDDRKVHFGPDNEDENLLPGCNDHNQAVGDGNHALDVRADYKALHISEGTEYDRAEYYCRRWLKWMSSYRSRAIEEQEALNVAAATRRRKRRNSAGWRKGLGA